MESDDDYQSFSLPEEPSPQAERQRFKRLKKKANPVQSDPLPDSIDDLLSIPRVDFAKLEALEASKAKFLDFYFDDSSEPLLSQNSPDHETEPEFRFGEEPDEKEKALEIDDELLFGEDQPGTKRVLEFDDVEKNWDLQSEKLKNKRVGDGALSDKAVEIDDGLLFREDHPGTKRVLGFDDVEMNGELQSEKLEKKRVGDWALSDKDEQEENVQQKKKKRIKSGRDDDLKSREPSSNKRKQEKERKVYLKQLHTESQRLLRETGEATFKPIPVVSKPISSVLEKIRRRKIEVSKKFVMLSNASNSENSSPVRDFMVGFESANLSTEDKEDTSVQVVEKEDIADQMDAQDAYALNLNKSNELVPPCSGIVPPQTVSEQKSTPMFRAPINDTEDLFGDSGPRENVAELLDDHQDSPLDEVSMQSLHSMNLKFDSVPSDDSFSEEDSDKENEDPLLHRTDNDCSSPKGDPVKAFIDEEAEEEDDSDNDLLRFQNNEEDEDREDSEEFNDIIATGYEENPVDNEIRNELHQKWLEQQDVVGTDNLLQRLKVCPKQNESNPLAQEEADSDDGEESDDEAEDIAPRYPTRINMKKAKEIITQMFVDKEDSFLSDEDEESEKRLVKQQLFVRTEEQATLVSPLEDESSREVFGLIKKLNIAPESRRAKAPSYFDSVLKGGNGKSFSKSSFLGRLSSHLPSQKKSSGAVRSFIFGRDDSNSRSSLSMSDDSSDTISKENQPVRTMRATVACSQSKLSSQFRNVSAETESCTSLFEVLKRSSSMQSVPCNQDEPVDLTNAMASFKIPKKPVRIGGRS